VYVAESRNILHCLEAKTGARQWSLTVDDLPLLGIADASVLTARDRDMAAETAGRIGLLYISVAVPNGLTSAYALVASDGGPQTPGAVRP
jgi:outer membrane protein assembly factor BamB